MLLGISPIVAIAPMMAYTDRHYRYLMRLLTKKTHLYTEMIHAKALIHGDTDRLLHFSKEEHPISLQVGGSDPFELSHCVKLAAEYHYDEVNLNVGCPSERVQSGEFGACLFKKPNLVANVVAAMNKVGSIPVTVKTRIGVDDHDHYQYLKNFVKTVAAENCQTFIIHARKAWLKGLNPKQNREIPPLDYQTVYQLKQDFPDLKIIINGGIKTVEEIQHHLKHVDGVMLGRESYANPFLFSVIDHAIFNSGTSLEMTRSQIVEDYLLYMMQEHQNGVSLRLLIKPLLSLFRDQPGARSWRRFLTENINKDNLEIVNQALKLVKTNIECN